MNVDSWQQTLNRNLEGFGFYLEEFLQFAVKTSYNLGKDFKQATQSMRSPIEFTDLQLTLLKVLLFLLLGTLVLIAYSWLVYGKVITEKFVRPSTLKEIEELKLSVAKLKLPKEHSPRI